MRWRRPSPEEQRHQQVLLLTVLRWCAFICPFSTVMYLGVYLILRRWPALAITGVVALLGILGFWGPARVRRGELRATTWALLTLTLLFAIIGTLGLDERPRAAIMLAFPGVLLLALALQSPSSALWMSSASVASLVAVVLVDKLAPLPKLEVSAWLLPMFDAFIPPVFLLLTLLGRAMTRHLREALAASEDTRAALERSNAQLAARRAALQDAQAHLSERAASLDKSNHEFQSFARGVSHDLLAPLRALEGDSVALQERCAGQLDEAGRADIQGIVDSARHMDALVTGLLDYSITGQPRAEVEAVDLGALLQRVATSHALHERAKLTVPPHAPTLFAHPVRLEQVFSNLLDNALKFQRPGVRPEIAVEWADRGDAWELAVRDNGIGIDPRHFEKIFGIFQRLHLQGEYEGTGIGLAIVKKAIEEHGGRVWVESAPGQGSVFRFTLPKPQPVGAVAVRTEAPPDASEASRRPASSGEASVPKETRRLAALGLKAVLVLSPVFALAYLRAFVRQPTWGSALPPLAVLVMCAGAGWGLVRLRREVMLPVRILLVVLMAAIVEHMLHREDLVLPSAASGMTLILLLSTFVERPSLSGRWLWAGALLYAAAMVARSALPMRSMELGPLGTEVIRFSPVMQMVVVGVFGRASIRYLREALAESRAAQAALKATNELLEREKAELMAAQARLSTLTATLARSNRDLQSFTYVASHDLRAPLRALNAYCRFLEEDCAAQLDDAGRVYIQRIARGARHMDALVTGLLDYSRLGRVPTEPEWVPARELVERVLAKLGVRAEADVRVPADLPDLWGRRAGLEQLLAHLIANAVKYRREGVRPAVALEWQDRGDAWELAVRDNGIGIEAKDLETVFGLFQRLGPREPYDGTGMGLAIARKVVEVHGGRIWAESTPGEGSVFRFTLPKPAGAPHARRP